MMNDSMDLAGPSTGSSRGTPQDCCRRKDKLIKRLVAEIERLRADKAAQAADLVQARKQRDTFLTQLGQSNARVTNLENQVVVLIVKNEDLESANQVVRVPKPVVHGAAGIAVNAEQEAAPVQEDVQNEIRVPSPVAGGIEDEPHIAGPSRELSLPAPFPPSNEEYFPPNAPIPLNNPPMIEARAPEEDLANGAMEVEAPAIIAAAAPPQPEPAVAERSPTRSPTPYPELAPASSPPRAVAAAAAENALVASSSNIRENPRVEVDKGYGSFSVKSEDEELHVKFEGEDVKLEKEPSPPPPLQPVRDRQATPLSGSLSPQPPSSMRRRRSANDQPPPGMGRRFGGFSEINNADKPMNSYDSQSGEDFRAPPARIPNLFAYGNTRSAAVGSKHLKPRPYNHVIVTREKEDRAKMMAAYQHSQLHNPAHHQLIHRPPQGPPPQPLHPRPGPSSSSLPGASIVPPIRYGMERQHRDRDAQPRGELPPPLPPIFRPPAAAPTPETSVQKSLEWTTQALIFRSLMGGEAGKDAERELDQLLNSMEDEGEGDKQQQPAVKRKREGGGDEYVKGFNGGGGYSAPGPSNRQRRS